MLISLFLEFKNQLSCKNNVNIFYADNLNRLTLSATDELTRTIFEK